MKYSELQKSGVEKLFESLELSDIVSLILSHSKRGLLKMQYFNKVILLSERGILNSSKQVQVEEKNNHSKTFLELFQPKVQEIITNIEMEPIMPIIEGLYWDFIMSLDNVNELNDMIKCHIRNEYYDMTNDYVDSILQRKISLNSKRLAIMNYIKQIQNETAIFSPYEIEYKIHAENYIGRKCDQSYYLKSKKRN